MSNFPCSGSIVQRSIKSKGRRFTMQPTRKRLIIFPLIVSGNQLSLHGAVAEICEEYESLHETTVRPVVMGQSSSSLVLSAIKTEVPLDSDDPAYQKFLLQQYGERIEKLSQQDKLSKFCMDAGFLSVVENGQYFMMKVRSRQKFSWRMMTQHIKTFDCSDMKSELKGFH